MKLETGRKLAVLVCLLLSIILAWAGRADAAMFDLREVSVEGKHFFPGGHYPLITDNGIDNRTLGEELNLTVKIDVLKYLFWDNTVHSMTDKVLNPDGSTAGGQFRLVGLEFGLGVDFSRMWDWLPVRVGYWHYSQHELDGVSQWHFPVQDAIAVKLIIYQGKGLK